MAFTVTVPPVPLVVSVPVALVDIAPVVAVIARAPTDDTAPSTTMPLTEAPLDVTPFDARVTVPRDVIEPVLLMLTVDVVGRVPVVAAELVRVTALLVLIAPVTEIPPVPAVTVRVPVVPVVVIALLMATPEEPATAVESPLKATAPLADNGAASVIPALVAVRLKAGRCRFA